MPQHRCDLGEHRRGRMTRRCYIQTETLPTSDIGGLTPKGRSDLGHLGPSAARACAAGAVPQNLPRGFPSRSGYGAVPEWVRSCPGTGPEAARRSRRWRRAPFAAPCRAAGDAAGRAWARHRRQTAYGRLWRACRPSLPTTDGQQSGRSRDAVQRRPGARRHGRRWRRDPTAGLWRGRCGCRCLPRSSPRCRARRPAAGNGAAAVVIDELRLVADRIVTPRLG